MTTFICPECGSKSRTDLETHECKVCQWLSDCADAVVREAGSEGRIDCNLQKMGLGK